MKYLFIIIILLLLFLYLFREPSLKNNSNLDTIISPAYGKIYKIEKIKDYICISIILTVFDVHFQYIPTNGIIKRIIYDRNGIFNIVFNSYDKTKYNEKMIYELQTMNGTIYIYQIAGFFFRRIIPFVKENQFVQKGNKLGLITFGSRVDICLPSNGLLINVSENQYVNGGDILGTYKK